MTPATERACGASPAAMLRHLVALSFNNIENLYAHLGLHDQLPIECRDLGKMTESSYGTETLGRIGKSERTVFSGTSGILWTQNFELSGTFTLFLLTSWIGWCHFY